MRNGTIREVAVSGLASMFLGCLLILGVTRAAPLDQAASTKTEPCEGRQSAPVFSVAGTSEEKARAFLVALQEAVAAGDKRKVASMIRYPIVAQARGRNVRFKTPASMVASYDRVFTAPLKKLIADARTECLFTNWKGLMIHDGEIWMGARSSGDLRIITINGVNR